jgi:hypothetical protein
MDIVFVEANRSYCEIYLTNGEKRLCTKSLSEVEKKLPSTIFFRCHQSYVINLNYLQEFNKKHPTVWRYSLPLFSLDYSKVILIESYSCGTACGGVSFILYERKEKNWRKVSEFNQLSN